MTEKFSNIDEITASGACDANADLLHAPERGSPVRFIQPAPQERERERERERETNSRGEFA